MMKKALLVLGIALAAQPSLAGTGQPIIYPAPAPAPCPQPCPYTFEMGFKYGFANSDIFRGNSSSADTYGGDITAAYNMNACNSINLRFGYTFGDTTHWEYGVRRETDLHTFYLMPGYRFTHAFNDKWAGYIGANVGVANLSVKDHLRWREFTHSDHDSEFGFAYSGEIGVRYRLCETRELFLAYEFFGSTASPSTHDNSVRKQTYNVIRTGMSFKF